MSAVLVKNADRMMTSAMPVRDGIEVAFADGRKGIVPFSAIPELSGAADLGNIEMPNPYEIILRATDGSTAELPWDFVRHYCDTDYAPRVESAARAGRGAIGRRIRELRAGVGMTQGRLAHAAGVGRVTLVRIERGEQSPRYETLVSLAAALGKSPADLMAGTTPPTNLAS